MGTGVHSDQERASSCCEGRLISATAVAICVCVLVQCCEVGVCVCMLVGGASILGTMNDSVLK